MSDSKPALPGSAEMARAYLGRDASYDGIFFLAVRTTGIFCKPSCPARKPHKINVQYFSSAREAIFAGYRPCKRCHPLHAGGAVPSWIQEALDLIEQDPTARFTDARLRSMGIDPVRTRRFFLKTYGMTFQAYCRGRRLGQSLEQIRMGADLDDIVLGHGFDSHSGFREAFVRAFGQPPGRSRTTGCILIAWIESPLGPLLAGATTEGICLLEFTDRRMLEAQFRTLRRLFSHSIVPGENAHLKRLKVELDEYFSGTRTTFTIPLSVPGTDFQKRVWNGLLTIPYGQTVSYDEIAGRIGSPDAQRAVGRANGMNRIAIVIPCHRV